jgi:hypothetical protein
MTKLTITSQVFNHPQTRLPIRNSGIQIMLFAILINTESFEIDVTTGTKLRFHGTWDINRTLDAQLFHPTLHHGKLDRDLARHLNGATERDLAVALREMQISG